MIMRGSASWKVQSQHRGLVLIEFARTALSPETGQVAVAQVGQSRATLAEAAQTWQLAA